MSTAALLTIAKMQATEVPINRWKDKEDVVYLCSGTLLNHKKEWDLAICNNMDGPRGYYAKWNKSDREKTNTTWFHLYVEFKQQNKHNKTETVADTKNKLVVARGG